MADSFIDHGLLLRANARYARGVLGYAGGDADAFARLLQKAGLRLDLRADAA